jgi:nicotinamide mononucleotide (NMN) deamidase PncC
MRAADQMLSGARRNGRTGLKALLLTAAILLPGVALAAGNGSDKQDKKHDGLVCRDIAETGSRLSSKRICMTKEQWEENRRETRQSIERAQTQQTNPKGG